MAVHVISKYFRSPAWLVAGFVCHCHCLYCRCLRCHCLCCHCLHCHFLLCHCLPCHCLRCHCLRCQCLRCQCLRCHSLRSDGQYLFLIFFGNLHQLVYIWHWLWVLDRWWRLVTMKLLYVRDPLLNHLNPRIQNNEMGADFNKSSWHPFLVQNKQLITILLKCRLIVDKNIGLNIWILVKNHNDWRLSKNLNEWYLMQIIGVDYQFISL